MFTGGREEESRDGSKSPNFLVQESGIIAQDQA